MPKNLVEIASELVQAQVSLTSMTTADMTSSLRQVFNTLQEMQKAEIAGINVGLPLSGAEAAQEIPSEEKPALTPQDSIQNDKIICLECGAEFRQLNRNHLASHGMNQKDYKKKYGFTMRTPLSAKTLTKIRQKAAKRRGVPENLKKNMEARRQENAEVSKPIALENSIQDDKIICLECGAEFKQLTGRHLVTHGLTPTEYKKKYGFSMETPLLAKSVSKAMSEAQTRRQEKAKAALKPAATEASGLGTERAKRVRKRFSPKKVE